jgi:hypothetical protein
MKITLAFLATLLLALGAYAAQHGTAPSGYYQPNYFGDTWTGTVVSTNDQTREITLAYTTKKGKTETFTGVLQKDYKIRFKDGSVRQLKPSYIPVGTRLVVYYIPRTKKLNGRKIKTYEIFRFTKAPPAT